MTLTDLAHQKVHQDKIEPKSSLLNQYVRSPVQSTPAHQTSKPQPFAVGVFSCLIAPVSACCWGFLRTPADFASRPNWPFRATFHSLLAIPRSDLAPWNWPEVRKGRNTGPYRSEGYARTNQAVGLQHWLPEWANVPSAKPAVLPSVLFDMAKQFLRIEPGPGVS